MCGGESARGGENGATDKGLSKRKWSGKPWVLSHRQLELISAYRYRPGPSTPLDRLLTPFWDSVTLALPSWLAPNLVTFIGFCSVCLSSCMVIMHSSDLQSPAPSWVYYMHALGIFIYQTMDNVDGKQARRTNSSSPLGQLFDHGCDALVTSITLVASVAGTLLGPTEKSMLILLPGVAVFYMYQWEEYHTCVLNVSANGWYGVCESQLFMIGLFIICGIWGPHVFHVPIQLGPISISMVDFTLLVWAAITASMMAMSVIHVITARKSSMPEVERGEKTLGVSASLTQLAPFALSLWAGYALAMGPGFAIFLEHPALLLLGIGLVSADLSTRMILHHMAKSPCLLHDLRLPSVVALFAASLNLHWPSPYDPYGLVVPHGLNAALCLSVAFLSYFFFVIGCIRDLAFHLDIHVFSLKNVTKRD
jgi:ethanolaminephosphotransferase